MRRNMSQALVTVRERMELWREAHGGPGSRIPKALWDEAVGVAREEGVSAASRALRLDYIRLRDRVAVAEGHSQKQGFVELEMGQFWGSGRTVVEFERRDGARMRVETAAGADLEGLTRVFWSSQP
jgi:hypothetical protein